MVLTIHLAICLLAMIFACLAALSWPKGSTVQLGWLAVALIALALVI